jgi:4-hydroxy-tetrahydrodipicolinate synthase
MELSAIRQALRTVVAIPVTPFGADGRLDAQRYQAGVRRMIDAGIKVMTPNGNTGEFYSLTPAETTAALDATIAEASKGVDDGTIVLAGVGFDGQTAVEMARHAERRGAQAAMVHQPVHPFRSKRGWLDYHYGICDAVPQMGIVPYVRDAAIDGSVLAELAQRCPNFVGVKFAIPDPILFTASVHAVARERLTWICGLAEGWAPFFWVGGAEGFTSGLVNVAPKLSLQMLHDLQSGDQTGAMAIWRQIKPFEDLRARQGNALNVSVVKEAMHQAGYCDRRVRPPISELTEEERAEVSTALSRLSVIED